MWVKPRKGSIHRSIRRRTHAIDTHRRDGRSDPGGGSGTEGTDTHEAQTSLRSLDGSGARDVLTETAIFPKMSSGIVWPLSITCL